MSQSTRHPLEELLLAIAHADPRPWDYRQEATRAGIDPRELEGLLELLWLEGLITKSDSSTGDGAGVVLTDPGRQVLEDPEALARLRAGEALTPGQGAVVRNSLRRPITPYITRILLVANLAVFGYCIWLAHDNRALLTLYLTSRSNEVINVRVFHPAGAVALPDIVRGDWWRLLTSCFVHAGILHILFNMYTLHAAGRFVEQTWGHWRYLIIYLISGWAGSCFGLTYMGIDPRVPLDRLPLAGWPPVVGASGALCGILAADGVWIYVNGRHLPRALVRRGRMQFWTNVVLMTFISFLPGISGWGHLAGALAGAAAGLVLHLQRFGPAVFRVLGLLALVPLAWYPYHYLEDVGPRSRAWQEAERLVFQADVIRPVQATMREAVRSYREAVKPIRDRHPDRRDPEEVATAVKALDQQLADLSELTARLERQRFRDKDADEARQKALEYARAREEAFRETKRCLSEGKAWKGADEKKLDDLWDRVAEKRKAWEALLE
jgi:rhomboid protease GluP